MKHGNVVIPSNDVRPASVVLNGTPVVRTLSPAHQAPPEHPISLSPSCSLASLYLQVFR
jgi:hypothetical protein